MSKERKEYISKLLPGGNKQTKDFSNYEVNFLEILMKKNIKNKL